ncbi:MAG: hypothetical protein KDD48_08380, partial [Bdellovibrionales bacterium]|nr:hypothetical protein [Bdellovibrionales bacterium]
MHQADGTLLEILSNPKNIVSLVPSVTQDLIRFGKAPIGRTAFCVEPRFAVSTIPIIGGTKTPNIPKIIELAPDLVIANQEENIKVHVEQLQREGLAVWVQFPISLSETLEMLLDLEKVTGPGKYSRSVINHLATVVKGGESDQPKRTFTFAIPIWKDPWMAAGSETYIDSLMSFVGGTNVFKQARYPKFQLSDLEELQPEIIILPTEPYSFTENHKNDLHRMFSSSCVELFSGEDLCWPGTRSFAA